MKMVRSGREVEIILKIYYFYAPKKDADLLLEAPKKLQNVYRKRRSTQVAKSMKILKYSLLKLFTVQNTDEITPSLAFLATLVALHFTPVRDTVGRSFKIT